jgi:hypothetical protein
LLWENNRSCTKFVLEEDTTKNFDYPTTVYEGSGSSYAEIEKTNGTYFYRVKGCNDLYEGCWSNVVDITVDKAPEVPGKFNVSVYPEGNGLNLSWRTNLIDCAYYHIYYLTDKMQDWELLVTVYHPNNTFNHLKLTDGQVYSYKIKAFDARGQSSGFSKVVSGVPADTIAPKPPEGLKTKMIAYNQIVLAWDENFEDDVKGYNIFKGNVSNKTSWGDLIGTVYSNVELEFIDYNVNELTEYFYRIKAFDEVPNDSGFSKEVSARTPLGPHPPEINNSIEDIEILEDGYDDSSIDLLWWFKDVNGDTLTFTVTGQENIEVFIFDSNGTVILIPDKNWHGYENLTFYANDSIHGEVSDNVMIHILPVNDPPGKPEIVAPTDGTTLKYGKTINFIGRCNDVDQPKDELTFTWNSSIDGELGTGDELKNIALSVGVHQITLTVSDLEGESSFITIEVIIEAEEVVISGEDNDNWSVLAGSISVVVILIILIFILLIFLKKRKKKDREKDQDLKTGETSTSKMTYEQSTQLMMKIPADRSNQTQTPSGTQVQYITPTVMPYSEMHPGQQPPAPAQELDAEIDMVLDSETQIMQKYSAQPEQPYPGEAYAHELTETEPIPQLPEHAHAISPGEIELISEPLAAQDGLSQTDISEVAQTVENGKAYIVKTKSIDFGLDIFDHLIASTPQRGLIITRTYPSKLSPSQTRDVVTKIWLSKSGEPDSVAPENITKLSHVISEFQSANDNAVLLLDGLDYLISNNDFPRILKFIEYLHEKVILNSGILLIALNPHVLSSEYLELLENELVNIITDPLYYKLNSNK